MFNCISTLSLYKCYITVISYDIICQEKAYSNPKYHVLTKVPFFKRSGSTLLSSIKQHVAGQTAAWRTSSYNKGCLKNIQCEKQSFKCIACEQNAVSLSWVYISCGIRIYPRFNLIPGSVPFGTREPCLPLGSKVTQDLPSHCGNVCGNSRAVARNLFSPTCLGPEVMLIARWYTMVFKLVVILHGPLF